MQSREEIQIYLNIALIVISSLLYGARCYSRLIVTKNAGLDDALIGVGLVLTIAFSLVDNRTTGNGVPQEYIARFYKYLPTSSLLYLAISGIIRLGITAFLPRLIVGLAREKTFRNIIIILALSILTLMVGSFCGYLFRCWPVKGLWDEKQPGVKCYPRKREAFLMYTQASLGVLFDICLFALPIWIIKSSLVTAVKPQIVVVFSVALVAIACGLVRLIVLVAIAMPTRVASNIAIIAMLTGLELHIGIWVACFPALQPLLRCFHRRMADEHSFNPTAQVLEPSERSRRSARVIRDTESDMWTILDTKQVQTKADGPSHSGSRNSNVTTVVESPVVDSFADEK